MKFKEVYQKFSTEEKEIYRESCPDVMYKMIDGIVYKYNFNNLVKPNTRKCTLSNCAKNFVSDWKFRI